MAQGNSKETQTFAIAPKAKDNLEQLVKGSGMTKSEILNKLLIDYKDSIEKKICV